MPNDKKLPYLKMCLLLRAWTHDFRTVAIAKMTQATYKKLDRHRINAVHARTRSAYDLNTVVSLLFNAKVSNGTRRLILSDWRRRLLVSMSVLTS